MTYGKTHLSIDKSTWERGTLSKQFANSWVNLDLLEIKNPSWSDFKPLIDQIETGNVKWAELPQYQEEVMRPILSAPTTQLLLLMKDDNPVGYSLIVEAKQNLKNRFWNEKEDRKIIEIENLALFKGQRGNGIGKSFFEMIFKDLFKTNDTVYWGCSDFNADTLVPFYTNKMMMSVLAYEPAKKASVNLQVA